ncbi:MAG: AI-2E family transporter [Drouetiella hepatica Uher 2000/2452]|uniref:AI-2E family transporter n=1 Tax=Drouetiella hepatica Uher 2000/2452 TaxID=904376 RepID=A0A951QH11_9CYAN|nr:AI-2E family transporter [Drouetiella hepatica Uher 2000/2452]
MKLGQWLSFLCIIISLILLWQARNILLLVFTAVVLATALNSLVMRFRKSGMRRDRAVMLTLLISFLLIILFTYLIVPPFANQLLKLGALVPQGFTRVVTWLEELLNNRPAWLENVQLPSADSLIEEAQPVLRAAVPNFFSFFSGSLSVVLQILLLAILTLMLLANPEAYRHAVIRLFPSFYRHRADAIFLECETALVSWMGGALISSTVVAVLSAIGLWALNIQFVLAQALLAGLLNFIPNLGPTLSMVFPLTVAALDAPWKVVAVIILYVVIQNLESYWLTPTVMANQVSLLPAMTLAAQLMFASLFGFMGLLLALPLAVVAKTLIQEVLIKDILDNWKNEKYKEPPLVTGEEITDPGQPTVFSASDLPEDLFED